MATILVAVVAFAFLTQGNVRNDVLDSHPNNSVLVGANVTTPHRMAEGLNMIGGIDSKVSDINETLWNKTRSNATLSDEQGVNRLSHPKLAAAKPKTAGVIQPHPDPADILMEVATAEAEAEAHTSDQRLGSDDFDGTILLQLRGSQISKMVTTTTTTTTTSHHPPMTTTTTTTTVVKSDSADEVEDDATLPLPSIDVLATSETPAEAGAKTGSVEVDASPTVLVEDAMAPTKSVLFHHRRQHQQRATPKTLLPPQFPISSPTPSPTPSLMSSFAQWRSPPPSPSPSPLAETSPEPSTVAMPYVFSSLDILDALVPSPSAHHATPIVA